MYGILCLWHTTCRQEHFWIKISMVKMVEILFHGMLQKIDMELQADNKWLEKIGNVRNFHCLVPSSFFLTSKAVYSLHVADLHKWRTTHDYKVCNQVQYLLSIRGRESVPLFFFDVNFNAIYRARGGEILFLFSSAKQYFFDATQTQVTCVF
jgi:hypothetical protein